MKRILLVLATSAALSASGQVSQEAPKTASGGANSGKPATIIIQGEDGRTHELQLPMTPGQMQVLVQSLENTRAQAGCPVQILKASFDRPAQLMLTARTQVDDGPTLRLDYRNLSGKEIDSAVFTGWIKVKDSPYQLDSVTHPFQMEVSQKALLDGGQAFKLVSNAIGFDRIELSQVTYVDGTTWTPERNCVYANVGSSERAKAW
jgi:hypothetical protein